MATADNARHPAKMIGPAEDVIPITVFADSALVDGSVSYIARGFLCSCDGTATIKTANGNTRTGVPLAAGWNPGPRAARVLAWTPSVTGGTLWGVK